LSVGLPVVFDHDNRRMGEENSL